MVMTVECPSCASTFPVDPAKVPEGGVNARCTVCSNVFRVERPRDDVETQATGPAAEDAPETEGAGDLGTTDQAAAAGAGPTDVADPARAAVPGAHPASQADTESRVESPETRAEPGPVPGTETEPEESPAVPADAGEAEGDEETGDVLEDEGDGSSRITGGAPLTGGGGGADATWGTGDADAGIATEPDEPDHGTPGEEPTASGQATEEAEEEAAAEDWVFETDDDLGAGEAVSAGADATHDDAWQGGVFEVDTGEAGAEADAAAWATPSLPPEVETGGGEPEEVREPVSEADAPTEGPTAPPEGEIETPGPTPDEPQQPIQGFSFGQRDPADKARRLARVLVSDMIMYNPERHQRALEDGTLEEDFEDEIAKSWKEYVEQVGEEMARGTDYWRDALNDILAKGDEVF